MTAVDTWAQHCRLQQSQLHCSLDWQPTQYSPLDSVSKIQITSVLHMLLVVRRRPQIMGTNNFSLGASCFLAGQAKSLGTVICGGICRINIVGTVDS